MFLTWIKTKLKMKRVVAGALACALTVTAVVSGLEPGTFIRAHAYNREYGICIDNHTVSASGANCRDDIYSNKLKEIWNLDPNSDAYKQGLQYNLNWLHANIGDEETITKLFFGGLFTYVTELGVGGADATSVQAMYDYVYRSMWDSAMSGTFPELNAGGDQEKQRVIDGTIPMTETELGMLLHGAAGQQVLSRHRLLQIISEDTKNVFDASDWKHVPQVLPRLSKAWLQSYGTYQSGQTGMALWPAGSQAHTVQSNGRDPIQKDSVQAAALDMTKDSAYFSIGGKGSSGGSEGAGSEPGEGEDDSAEESGEPGEDGKETAGSQEDGSGRTDYYMNLTKEMFENAVLMIWNDATNSWFTYSPILYNANRALHGSTGEVINGWNIQTVWEGDNYYIQFHDTTNGAAPQPLYMYFNIQQGAVVSSSEAVFDSVEAFCATYMKVATCDKCPRGRRALNQHQRFVSFWPYQYNSQLPCFSLGGVGSTWTDFPRDQQAGLHFCIYSHNEDWTTDYNVQLKKYDAETGKPLEDAEFKLYERFDDKDEINPDSDGAVELYEGDGNASGDSGKDDSGSSSKEGSDDDDSGSSGTHAGKWQGGYTSSPVVWDDFREVFDGTTDSDGYIHFDSTKSYHYEKTFCDGHPLPQFINTDALEDEDDDDDNEAVEEAKEQNKEVANQWLSYVESCEKMAEEERPGVHFHWMLDESMKDTVQDVANTGEYSGDDEGTMGDECPTGVDTAYEKSGAKQDCQDTYDKFIALKYSYTWKEIRARSGYTIHVKDDEEEGHTDDVPIEIITTDSSQNGANSNFGGGYSKDITINENAAGDSDSGNETSGKDEGENTNEAKASRLSFTTKVNPLTFFGLGITAHAAENAESAEAEEEKEKKSGFDAFFGKVIRAISFFTESDDTEDEEAEEADEEDIDEDAEDSGISIENTGEDADDTDDEEIATDDKEKITADVSSITDGGAEVASGSDLPENKKTARKAGIAKLLPGLFKAARVIADDEDADDEDEDSGDAEVSGGEDYMAIWEKAFEDPQVGGEDVELGPDDNWSHCNDKDGEGNMWRVYDHRTEGEIHFNKRDFDLSDNRDKMDDYAAGNGDGTLEGAVYGLFARNDIVHPDGKTGVVYKKDDLVAVATTDRNGDGSFMAFTEAPGTRYDYKTGKLYHTDWYNQAPKNLYRPAGHTSELQPNVTFNKGVLRNTQWYSDDYTEDGAYTNGALTQRVCDDNETNNGNCWIGRPLIVSPEGTTYYIKELSRSEGYELSVNGKDRYITNYGAPLDTASAGGEDEKGQVDITANLYIQGQESIGLENEPFFTVTSKDMNEKGGYDIVVNKLPEGTKFYRHDTVNKDQEETVTTGYTTRFKGDTNQNGKIDAGETWVQKKADTDGIPKYDPATNKLVTHTEEATVTLSKLPIAENKKNFDESSITDALNEGDGAAELLTTAYTADTDSQNFRFVKWKLETALRTAGFSTPKKDGNYSALDAPVYQRGVKQGETDPDNVSGAGAGQKAGKTVYGPALTKLTISSTTESGTPLTNGDLIMNLVQYYENHPYWSLGGIDRIVENGDKWDVYIYTYNPRFINGAVIPSYTDTDGKTHERTVYRALRFIPETKGVSEDSDEYFTPRYVFVPYTEDGTDAFGTYKDYSTFKMTTGTQYAAATITPDAEISGDGTVSARENVVADCYNIGDSVYTLDADGKTVVPEYETETVPVTGTLKFTQVERSWTEVPAKFENGKYIIHADVPYTDAYGITHTDADAWLDQEYKAVVPEGTHVLTEADMKDMGAYRANEYGVKAGDKMSSGSYEVYAKHAYAEVYRDYGSAAKADDSTYIKEITLNYPGQDNWKEDGGTIEKPVQVVDRPIRQKIKVTKDVATPRSVKVWYCANCGQEMDDGVDTCEKCGNKRTTEETKTITYNEDTYSAVHEQNKETSGNGTAKDWLTKLLKGELKGEDKTAEKIPDFRFKAYLKSNLERLYRDEDGNITWLDRNGNEILPVYRTSNAPADETENYLTDENRNKTFYWKYASAYQGMSYDFPEKDKESGGVLQSANVQKIYTKIIHNQQSRTISGRANNFYDVLKTPQGGAMDNVGEKSGYITSERPDQAPSIAANSVLYSYNGRNTDVARSDQLNADANTGYTRLLETTEKTMEDGADGSRTVEAYNYEKFFDAIAAANTDVWDSDMYTTFDGTKMSDYPGQHWEETFYDKYQKDDAESKDSTDRKEDTDGTDQDNTAGGDKDTSFKPFQYLREHIFGNREDHEKYQAENNGQYTENTANTSDYARANAEASDAVRQFAAKWYLEDEAAKLITDNGLGENIAKDNGGKEAYDEEIHDRALFEAIKKAYDYLKPFYTYDLDTIYSVEWDSEKDGGADKDYTTLSINTPDGEKYSRASAYLPYGVYVIVEQQPEVRNDKVNDFETRHYTTDAPKEVIVPTVYDAETSNETADNYESLYNYSADMDPQDQAKESNYLIRFSEEWGDSNTQDEREYVIRAHNYYGDYEVYKYGLDTDKITSGMTRGIRYPGGAFDYDGFRIAQEPLDPIKDRYNESHYGIDLYKETNGEQGKTTEIGKENGGNNDCHDFAIDVTDGKPTANGLTYDGKYNEQRQYYAAISEDEGYASSVLYKGETSEDNASGMTFRDSVISMTGELTAYDGKYSAALVPWSVTEPADAGKYSSADFTGYADVPMRDTFYTTYLRINKTDSETGEYILHDNAIFTLYAGSRYTDWDEIRKDAEKITDASERKTFLAQFKPGDAKFYLKDTKIEGSYEFLNAMGCEDIKPKDGQDHILGEPGVVYTGTAKKGTPVADESERIDFTDTYGEKTGQMTVLTTLKDGYTDATADESKYDVTDPQHTNDGTYYDDQNTGYFVTPQPIGSGVYVLAETKAPAGYKMSRPVAIEVYSDETNYYMDGDMYNKVAAVRYDSHSGKMSGETAPVPEGPIFELK